MHFRAEEMGSMSKKYNLQLFPFLKNHQSMAAAAAVAKNA